MPTSRPLLVRIAHLLFRPTPAEPPRCVRVFNQTRECEIAHSVELAGTAAQRSKGLLGRTSLAPGTGLWIVPCESVHTFGMKFALDLVYLDRLYRVVKIRTGVPPWRISASLRAHSVLELPSGSIQPASLVVGDQLQLSDCSTVETVPETPESPQ